MDGVEGCEKLFAEVEHALDKAGYLVFNPARLGQYPCWYGWFSDSEWKAKHREILNSELSEPVRRCWLRDDIIALSICDGIVALPGSDKSRGALAEFMWADAVGMEKFFWELKEDREKLLSREAFPRAAGATKGGSAWAPAPAAPAEDSPTLGIPLAKPADPISHPSHYTTGKIECIDALESALTGLSGLGAFCAGNTIKYLWRHTRKGGAEDLRKDCGFAEGRRLLFGSKPHSAGKPGMGSIG